jgi:ribosomal protein S3
MGQKTNPRILRLGVTQNWTSRYIEKKTSETAFYDFKTIEIKKFIYKFFKDHNLIIHNCKLNFANNKLEIFVSFYASTELVINNNNLIFTDQNKNKLFYKFSNYLTNLKKEPVKTKLYFFLKKKRKIIYTNNSKHKIFNENFINKLCQSIALFLKTKINIIITYQQLNKNLKKKISKQELQSIKKNLSQFYRYKNDKFYKSGLNIMYNSSINSNSAFLIAEFIAENLSKLKRHNYFLRFVIRSLQIFKKSKFSKLKGVKIKITGRINTRPRAKHRFIKVGKDIPLLSINSKIDYAEKTAFTSNGTLGVKVWTFH